MNKVFRKLIPFFILMLFTSTSFSIEKNWVYDFPSDAKFWIDHDGGFDVDDFLAHVVSAQDYGDKIVGASTSVYDPKYKAKLSKLIFEKLGVTDLSIYSGIGVEEKTDIKGLRNIFPGWPPQFGEPYEKQGESYEKVYSRENFFIKNILIQENAVDALIEASRKYKNKLIVVCQGPLTNIAKAINKDPTFAKNVNRFVVMGGWFEKNGSISRLGYNSIMDLEASKIVFEDVDAHILLVNAQTIADSNLVIKMGTEYALLLKSKKKSLLAEALFTDMENWGHHSKHSMDGIVLADPATAFLANHPEFIEKIEALDINLSLNREVHMLDPRAKDLIKVGNKGLNTNGHLQVVQKISSPDKLRLRLLDALFHVADKDVQVSRKNKKLKKGPVQ